ncbi:MAG TPA: hypothetical protein VJP76_08640 [Candidatus Tumulicola sp.]|nr:hypothetical protein [Candidatus Tumulicola sp.]
MKRSIGVLCALLSLGLVVPAVAQTPPYVDTHCGVWQGDTWVPNGDCPAGAYRHERLAGTITAVKGHLVTVQQTARTLVIDDTQALNNQLTGRVAVGRQIVAHGYWDNGTFYATIITTGPPTPG